MKPIQRIPYYIEPPWWLAHAYYDMRRAERVMAVWPLNLVLVFAWFVNHRWNRYRGRPSWIDREIERILKPLTPNSQAQPPSVG